MSSLERETQIPRPEPTPPAAPSPPEERRYWKSVERLLDSPAVQEASAVTPELPEGADVAPDELSRRTMMGLMGASFAMAGLAACRRPVEHIVPYVKGPETVIPGVPKHFATTLPFGTDAYGVVVESHEGRPTKIEGNESHPSSQGAASVWTQAEVLNLYDPDRSTHPRHRGGKDDGHGEGTGHGRAAWEDFESFWQAHAAELGDGSSLAVVSSAYSSPTLARLRLAFEARFPAARWVVHEGAGDGNVFAGVELATTSALRPVYHLGEAKTILALDSDLLHTESESVRHAREFAAGRRVTSTRDEMNRLYAVESTLTLTGAQADHRLRLRSDAVAGFAAALAGELGVAAPSAEAPAGTQEKLRLLAEDLRRAGSAALVVAGRRQPAEVHALALAMNQALGSLGTTVTLHELTDAGYGRPRELAELADAIGAGEVTSVVVLGGNPAYDAPADVKFGEALAKAAHSVHLSTHFDETSHLAEWHLPGTHFLEAWGDARAADGTLSVVQPLVAPLFGGRSAVEIVALLASDAHTSGYGLVRETWNDVLGADRDLFERSWRRVLHDGVHDGSASEGAAASVGDVSGLAVAAAGEGMEVTFHVCPASWDGRYANNAWLQELPDPITKITWDNAIAISRATAHELDVKTGDKLLLNNGGQKVEAPVFILPGQADGSLALFLGYGRTSAGRAGDGVGYSAYRAQTSSNPWFAAVRAKKPEKRDRHEFSQTQEHWEMAGRHHVREASLEEYRHESDFAAGHHGRMKKEKAYQLFDYHSYDEGYQWGMTIDLNACTGCNACIVACQSENNIPVVGKEQVSRGREMHWVRLDRYFTGHGEHEDVLEDPEVVFQPVPCMHCENAPCEQVCPVAATVHDEEGMNAMVYNRCIGTRYCSNNCPYKVRRFNFFNYTKDTPELVKMAQNPDVTVRSRGVMEKCSFCLQRVSEAKIAAKADGYREVRDGEIKTACEQTCPTQAITFGRINDENSRVAKLKANERNYVLLDELNNRPRVSYLAKLRNPNPAWPKAAGAAAAEGEHA